MAVSSLWSDRANGNIGFGLVGESHGEEFETFFILQVDDFPELLSEGSVVERETMFSDAKWKPKILGDVDLVKSTFSIWDPSQLIETTHPETGKVRKKTVTAILTGPLPKTFDRAVEKLCECAFFKISLLPLKTSKDVKRYDSLTEEWDRIATRFGFDLHKLKMQANSVHYGLRLKSS